MKIQMKLYEKLVGTEWEPIMVSKLKKGDTFRISKSGKYIEGEGGTTQFVAISDPYKTKDKEGQHWTIDYE